MLKPQKDWTPYIARCMTGDCDIWAARNWRPGDRGIVAYSRFEKSKLLIHCMLVRGERIMDARGSIPVNGDLCGAVSEMLIGSSAEVRKNCCFTFFDNKELFLLSLFVDHHRVIPGKHHEHVYGHLSLDTSAILRTLPEYKIEVKSRTESVKIPLSEQINSAASKLSLSGTSFYEDFGRHER